MANVTDPLINSLSGSDPQNLMEYITRQKIYDGRFWKEECFGLTVADVLEKAVKKLHCIGGIPTKFLALTLKLLQLHPETELVVETFVQQEEFKYVRALGCLYLRLTGRPAEIYETLEPLYRDRRKLRRWTTASQEWSILYMDEFIHQLLSSSSKSDSSSMILTTVGIALPRLPSRSSLEEAGYLPEGPRPTALCDVIDTYHGGDPLAYFQYKVQVEKSPAAIAAWERRLERLGKKKKQKKTSLLQTTTTTATASNEATRIMEEEEVGGGGQMKKDNDESDEPSSSEKRRPKKKQKSYGTLFKKDSSNSKAAKKPKKASNKNNEQSDPPQSEEYWNAERAKLGLKPLKK